MGKIYIEDIHVEDLFDWYERNIGNSAGDGTAVICCANHAEVATWFVEWWAEKNGLDEAGNRTFPNGHVARYGEKRFPHERDEYVHLDQHFVNYHDNNENYMFCDKEVDLGFGDYSFAVLGECRFGRWDSKWKERVVKPLGGK